MCQFFSFVTIGDGKLKYFTAKERRKLLIYYSSDSHTYIAKEKVNVKCGSNQRKDDLVNKYEYVNGRLIVDQINVHDDRKLVEQEIERFTKTKEFEKICIAAVKENWRELKYVKEQTPEICLTATKQYVLALQFVKKQTSEICLGAVKQNGWALQFVKKQTPEICLTAVKQNGRALQFVKEQTPEICLAAVQQNKQAVRFVKDPSLRKQLEEKYNVSIF